MWWYRQDSNLHELSALSNPSRLGKAPVLVVRLPIPPRYQMPVFPGCQLYFDDYDVRCNTFDCFNLFVNHLVFVFLNGFIRTSRNQRK